MMERPLRILHLVSGSDAGGISRYLLDLSVAMRDRGHQITLAGHRGAWHQQFIDAGLDWIEVPLKGGLFDFRRSVHTLRDWLAQRAVDVLHAHTRRATLLGRRLQRARGSPPLLYSLHLSHMAMSFGRRWVSDFGDVTHVPAIAGKRWLLDEKLVPEDRIAYVPHGIDPDKFPITTDDQRAAARAALNLSPDDTVAGYVGRLDYPKNVDWLLKVAEASRRELPNLKVLIAGDGPDESSLRALSKGLGDRVRFLGHRDPLPVYRASDALLLASLREGFGLSAAEAMSTGIPVLRTRTSGTEEMIVDNVTGLSTDVEANAFLSAAVEFLSDRQKLREMGRAAAGHVREHLPFSRQLGETIALYERVVARAR